MTRRVLAGLAFLTLGPVGSFAQETPTWADVGALFADRCTMCHAGAGAPLGLQLDTFEGALEGSVNGPVLVPGDLDGSELLRRVRGQSQPSMPLVGEPLDGTEIALIEGWVAAGLPRGTTADETGDDTADAAEQMPEPMADVPSLPGPGETVTFAHVGPILLQRCAVCHSDNGRMGRPPEGLRLDDYMHVVAGGERVAVVPGRPDASELVRRIEGTAQPRMPLDGPPWLSGDEIRLIRQWIAQGAADAGGEPAPMPVGGEVRFRGILTDRAEIDAAAFVIDGDTRIDDRPAVGQEAEMRGVVQPDGTIRATRLRAR